MVPTFLTKDGEVYLNDLRRYAKGTIIVPTEANSPTVIAASSDSPPIAIEGPQDAISEIFSLMGHYTVGIAGDLSDRLSVMIKDIAYRRDLMNRHCLINHVFGNGNRPSRLQESLLLENQQTITFEFRNASALGSSSYKIAAETRTFQGYGVAHPHVVEWLKGMRMRKAYLAPYWWTSDDAISIPVGATRDVYFTNTSDKFLLLCEIMATVITTGSTGTEFAERFTFELWDAKTQRRMMNQPVTMNTGTGTAQYPFRLDDPLLVEPLTQLVGRFKSLVTNGTIEVFFTFNGVQCLADPSTFSPAQLVQPNAAGLPAGMGRF
jgi:hypothetical protein